MVVGQGLFSFVLCDWKQKDASGIPMFWCGISRHAPGWRSGLLDSSFVTSLPAYCLGAALVHTADALLTAVGASLGWLNLGLQRPWRPWWDLLRDGVLDSVTELVGPVSSFDFDPTGTERPSRATWSVGG